MNLLDNLRHQIDRIDDEILILLNERADKALAVKRVKGKGTIYRPEREAVIVRRVMQQQHLLPKSSREAIYREIIAACRNLEQGLKVSYLGPAGSYSYEAAMKLVGSSSNLVPAASISEALGMAERGTVTAALLPIENSSEGMVAETHKLLRSTCLQIAAEMLLPIQHCLLSLEKDVSKLQAVHAHPQALGQCRQWLQIHLPGAHIVAEASNSSAAEIAAKSPHSAAIASSKAAELFGLHVLARSINDEPANQTRFVLLRSEPSLPSGQDKTSLVCLVQNKPGALHALLAIFAKAKINMTRLESQPVSPTEYAFYVDVDGHQADPRIAAALSEVASVTTSCVNLGSYPKATRSEP